MLNELKAQHREVARLKFEGFSPVEISDQTGLALTTVRGILADPLCKGHIDQLNDSADSGVIDVRKKLAEMSKDALEVISEILTYPDAPYNTRLSAAKDVLDRNGYAPPQQVNHAHLHLTTEELHSIKERAKAAGALSIEEDPSIEADYQEVDFQEVYQL